MTKPISLAVNGRYLTRPVSGVERFAHHLIIAFLEEARRNGALCHVTYYVPTDAVLHVQPPEGAALVRCGRFSGHAWEQIELPRARREQWLYSPCNVGPLFARNHIVTIHDAQVFLTPQTYSRTFGTWYRLLTPRLARRVRAVTTDSKFSAERLEALGVVPSGKNRVIYGGGEHILRVAPDTAALARHGLAEKRYLLAIGSLSPHKNIASIIKAVDATQYSKLPLVIAGGGNASVFSGAGFPTSSKVHFLGRVSDGELRALYDGAKALLFPSYYEGFGLPPLEAMNCGCPVIASNTSAMPEVCGDGAIYAAPDDVAAWTRAIDRLEQEPALADMLIAAGHEHIRNFTWPHGGKALFEMICEFENQVALSSQ